MEPSPDLRIPYEEHERVIDLVERLQAHIEAIALGFDRWGHERVFGPGLYLAVIVGPSFASYADPMAGNRWPSAATRDPFEDPEGFHEALEEVAYTRDGALVIAVDGVVFPQFVRFRSEEPSPDLEYADWMGARHMSALDVSTRDDVIATLALSQENGRVSLFDAGAYETILRSEIGDPWQDPAP